MDVNEILTFITTRGVDLGLTLLGALALWIIGRWLIGRVIDLVQAGMNRSKVDGTLVRYAGSAINVTLNIVLVIGMLGYLGIETTSFAALMAAAGLAIGTAWGGLLAHFAAGAFLLFLRPFKVGDFVCAGGVVGTVKEIGLFGTTIATPDNVFTVVGNNRIFSDTIQNFSMLPHRRVERTAQLAAGVDVFDAMTRLRAEVLKIPNIAKDQAPEISLLDFTAAGPVLAVRPYCHNDHYWQVYFDTNEAIVRVAGSAGWPQPATAHALRGGVQTSG